MKFTVPQRHYTMNAAIQRIVLQNAAAGGSESEFADALVNEIDGVTEQFGDHLERQMWGSYLGYRGTVASFTATTITLTNAAIVNIEQYIRFNATGHQNADDPRNLEDISFVFDRIDIERE